MSATAEAIVALGTNEGSDYKLTPTEHAGKLPASAKALRDLLERPEIALAASNFEMLDREAVRYERKYKALSKAAVRYPFLAVFFAVFALLMPWPEESFTLLRSLAGPAIYLGLSFGFICVLRILWQAPQERWLENRGKAELQRGNYFRQILEQSPNSDAATETALALLPLQLEYVRRYHLDVQKAYFVGRSGEHERSTRRSALLQGAAMLLLSAGFFVFLVTSLVPLSESSVAMPAFFKYLVGLADILDRNHLDHLFLGLQLVVIFVFGWSLVTSKIDNANRNATRYKLFATALTDITNSRLETAREAACSLDRHSEVLAFFEDVQSVLDSEHAGWKLAENFDRARAPAMTAQ